MKVLVLGGTRFVGRHLVERFAQTGHRVACFHRGRTKCPLPDGVDERYGDRDEDLSAVAVEQWDAIVDTSAFRPDQVRRSLELRAGWYLFISTLNVYQDLSKPGVAEDAATIEEFDQSDPTVSYGGNKAACERLVLERYPNSSTIIRPGLIAGRWDYSGRVTYWCERLLRGGRVLAPGQPNRGVQFIDAADLAKFAERGLSKKTAGIFNIVGPATTTTMGHFLTDCASVAAERGAPASTLTWVDARFLLQHGVEEWIEMPLWLTDPAFAGILQVSNAKALDAGLKPRPIPETVRSVLDWIAVEADVKRAGMSPSREAELLELTP